jgi:hypothetical protein
VALAHVLGRRLDDGFGAPRDVSSTGRLAGAFEPWPVISLIPSSSAVPVECSPFCEGKASKYEASSRPKTRFASTTTGFSFLGGVESLKEDLTARLIGADDRDRLGRLSRKSFFECWSGTHVMGGVLIREAREMELPGSFPASKSESP